MTASSSETSASAGEATPSGGWGASAVPEGPGPLLSLQVLRAAAALLVLVHHAGYDADTIAARRGLAAFDLDRVFDWGFGIHLFFVISGYIMLRTARGFGSARAGAVFMTRRVLRVVPLYWLLTSLVLIGAWGAPDLLNTPLAGAGPVLGSYLFVPVLRQDGDWQPVLGQGWTLDYEMFFYLLFATAMLLPRRQGVAALAGTLMALVLLGHALRPGLPFAVWTDGLLLEFLFGLLVGLAQEAGLRLPGPLSIAAAAAGVAAAIALGPSFAIGEGLDPWLRGGLPAAVIVGACVLGPPWPRNGAILAAAMLGDASYSLYLSHPFVVRLLRTAWLLWIPESVPLAIYLGLAGFAAVLAALVLYRLIERPTTRRLQRASRLAGADGRPILPDAATSSAMRRG